MKAKQNRNNIINDKKQKKTKVKDKKRDTPQQIGQTSSAWNERRTGQPSADSSSVKGRFEPHGQI